MRPAGDTQLADDRDSADDDEQPTEASAEPADNSTDTEAPVARHKTTNRTKNTTKKAKSANQRGWSRRRRRTRLAIRCTAAVVFVAVLAGPAAYEGWLLFIQHQRDIAAAQAHVAAQQFAGAFTNADPSTIDHQMDHITNMATGDFRERYIKSISAMRAMLIDKKVTTHGAVVASAVKSANAHTAEVLLFVKQTFTSPDLPKPPDAPAEQPAEVIGMAVTMEKVDGRWLVSKVVPSDKL